MRVARYIGNGAVAICDEATPEMIPGGLRVRTEACGLCSGELMAWYMEKKVPHVLGHEVSGVVTESEDDRFPVGSRVFPHHHAPCLRCDLCQRGQFVHCETWRKTKLRPGGMADEFVVAPENLADTLRTDDLRPIDAALIEPLACVEKSLAIAARTRRQPESDRSAVIGLGVMGLMHMLRIPNAVGYDLLPSRRDWANNLGLNARDPQDVEPADVVYICPGSQAALDFAVRLAAPGATLILFAPFGPSVTPVVPLDELYFKDAILAPSYSSGPEDTARARDVIANGQLRAEQVVSDFVTLDELPAAYQRMKAGEILKAMVQF